MKEIIVITGASSGFRTLAERALARVREFCVSHPIESDMRNGQFFRKESTMTQLEQVMYTATSHTTRGRNGVCRRDRRSLLATGAAAGAFSLVLLAAPCYAQTVPTADAEASVISQLAAKPGAAVEDNAIRPFRINVPEAALVDLRRRVVATRWPDKETVKDQSQGVQLAKLQALVRYWGTDYDCRSEYKRTQGRTARRRRLVFR
jgi:hypothetical protein